MAKRWEPSLTCRSSEALGAGRWGGNRGAGEIRGDKGWDLDMSNCQTLDGTANMPPQPNPPGTTPIYDIHGVFGIVSMFMVCSPQLEPLGISALAWMGHGPGLSKAEDSIQLGGNNAKFVEWLPLGWHARCGVRNRNRNV